MKTTADRIKEALEIRDMKQSDIVMKTGISKGALSSYISGKYVPKQTNTYLIAKALNVDVSWLMGNNVPMNPTTPKDGITDYDLVSLINRLRNDDKLQKLLIDFNILNESRQKIVTNLIQTLIEND